MIKLNQQQIDTLSRKIDGEVSKYLSIKVNGYITDDKDKIWKDFIKTEQYKIISLLIQQKDISYVAIELNKYMSASYMSINIYNNLSIEEVKTKILTTIYEYKYKKIPNYYTIRDDIILNSIESEDITQLINKIKSLYIIE